ncbi:MAG: flavin reductase family protein [Phyllobacterium sp.]
MERSSKSVDASEFREAMREVASGVTIVTSGSGERARGMTATAFNSLSAEPPSVLVCVNRDAECHRVITDTGVFCINVLGAAARQLANHFAGRDGVKGAARFQMGDWATLSTGAPVLTDALVAFDCRLREAIDAGTHTIFIGDVAALSKTGGNALVYRQSGFAPLA